VPAGEPTRQPRGNQNGECPILHEAHALTQNYAALNALYQSLAPDGSTPTGESLNRVVGELERGQRANDRAGDRRQSKHMLHAIRFQRPIRGAGKRCSLVKTCSSWPTRALADWSTSSTASTPRRLSRIKPAATKNGLTAQFADILSHVSFCEVRTQRDIAPDEASQGRVLLDGKPLAYGASDGFRLKDARHVEIMGSACEAIKGGAKLLSVRISCE